MCLISKWGDLPNTSYPSGPCKPHDLRKRSCASLSKRNPALLSSSRYHQASWSNWGAWPRQHNLTRNASKSKSTFESKSCLHVTCLKVKWPVAVRPNYCFDGFFYKKDGIRKQCEVKLLDKEILSFLNTSKLPLGLPKIRKENSAKGLIGETASWKILQWSSTGWKQPELVVQLWGLHPSEHQSNGLGPESWVLHHPSDPPPEKHMHTPSWQSFPRCDREKTSHLALDPCCLWP